MNKTILLYFVLLLTSCKSLSNSNFITDDDDITVEKPVEGKSYDENYNDNNVILKKVRIFTYSYIVKGTANSRIGSTELISYFNEKFGFVKLDYTNINGTKTILNLDKVD